jgi:hypothetical protein
MRNVILLYICVIHFARPSARPPANFLHSYMKQSSSSAGGASTAENVTIGNGRRVSLEARGTIIYVEASVIEKVPFLQAQMEFMRLSLQETMKMTMGELVADQDPAIVSAVLAYVESGNGMHLFSKLPRCSSAKEMLAVLDYLCVARPSCRKLDDASFKHESKDIKDETIKICGGFTKQSKETVLARAMPPQSLLWDWKRMPMGM